MACLHLSGNIPEVRERLAIAVIIGNSSCIQSFKSQAGMGSRLHDLLFMVKINCLTSSVVDSLRLLNVVSLIASVTLFRVSDVCISSRNCW